MSFKKILEFLAQSNDCKYYRNYKIKNANVDLLRFSMTASTAYVCLRTEREKRRFIDSGDYKTIQESVDECWIIVAKGIRPPGETKNRWGYYELDDINLICRKASRIESASPSGLISLLTRDELTALIEKNQPITEEFDTYNAKEIMTLLESRLNQVENSIRKQVFAFILQRQFG